MVLPPSAPDDASGPATPGWLRRLKVSLGLSRAGLLVLVDHARPERLGELVRALLPIAPELEVHTEAQQLVETRPGSTLVLIPRAEDADWLNINRPLFASRALRVVLFCTREVSVALSRGAVDFLDWVSLRLECPAGPPPYAVAGLRRALAARVPGIVWTGGDLEASFAAARPHRVLRKVSAARPYAELVAEARASRPGEWLAWTDVDGDFQLRRVRWALAEARRRTRTLLIEPAVRSPGWWEVHGQVAEPGEASEGLRKAGGTTFSRMGVEQCRDSTRTQPAGTNPIRVEEARSCYHSPPGHGRTATLPGRRAPHHEECTPWTAPHYRGQRMSEAPSSTCTS